MKAYYSREGVLCTFALQEHDDAVPRLCIPAPHTNHPEKKTRTVATAVNYAVAYKFVQPANSSASLTL